jgi:hypothetical protein
MSEVYIPSQVVDQQTQDHSGYSIDPDQRVTPMLERPSDYPVNPDRVDKPPKPVRPPIIFRDGR